MSSWLDRIKQAGISQAAFADHLGIYRQELNDYIHGRKQPSLKRFDRIERELAARGV